LAGVVTEVGDSVNGAVRTIQAGPQGVGTTQPIPPLTPDIQMRRGPVALANGGTTWERAGQTGAQVVHDAHGRYAEACRQGRIFSAIGTSLTPAATGTTGTLTLFNPYGSTVQLELLMVSIGYRSGTMTFGYFSLATTGVIGEVIPTGTAVVSRCSLVNGKKSVGRAITTTTLANAPVDQIILANCGPCLATSVLGLVPCFFDIGAAIILPPGTSVTLGGTLGAGTAALVDCTFVWEEVDIV
jgi:hypothetical protein